MRVSVIIPTLNRSALLQQTLSSLLFQKFPADQFEIVVVDNGSIDDTRGVAISLIEKKPYHHVRYVYEPEAGLLAARHRGAFEARGELLVFIDDDIEAARGWLAAVVTGFDDSRVQLIGGRNLPKYEVTPPAWIESFWETTPFGGCFCYYLSLLDLGPSKLRINPNYILGLNFAIRRNVFYDLGGFHPDGFPDDLLRFRGDGEHGLTMLAESRGILAHYHPDATIYHHVSVKRMTLEYFEKRAYLEGVCDSYSSVRRNGGPSVPLLAKAHRLAGKVLRHIRQSAQARMFIYSDDRATAAIHKRVERARQAGFEFHQRAIRADPNVLDWVVRPNYWDYRLPR